VPILWHQNGKYGLLVLGVKITAGGESMVNQGELDLGFEERRLVERFQSLLGEVREKATAAVDGTVIDCIEGIFLGQGRDLLRQAVETEIQLQADLAEVEKKTALAHNAVASDATKDLANEI
jgi:hypothetical protein